MKMVPFTVMVPEHYLEFMETMETILTDFKFTMAMEYVDSQVLANENRNFIDAVDWAMGGWTFDTPQEEKETERLILLACRKLAEAERASKAEARSTSDTVPVILNVAPHVATFMAGVARIAPGLWEDEIMQSIRQASRNTLAPFEELEGLLFCGRTFATAEEEKDARNSLRALWVDYCYAGVMAERQAA